MSDVIGKTMVALSGGECVYGQILSELLIEEITNEQTNYQSYSKVVARIDLASSRSLFPMTGRKFYIVELDTEAK